MHLPCPSSLQLAGMPASKLPLTAAYWLGGCAPPPLQGETVRLGNSHAALLEGAGASWEEALQEGSTWRLVEVLQP